MTDGKKPWIERLDRLTDTEIGALRRIWDAGKASNLSAGVDFDTLRREGRARLNETRHAHSIRADGRKKAPPHT